uniref:Uncharacterized protein n=1 Tax=Moniliophthora roreri TaxID=221103 RepID=A0A0W0FTH8_MONRR
MVWALLKDLKLFWGSFETTVTPVVFARLLVTLL